MRNMISIQKGPTVETHTGADALNGDRFGPICSRRKRLFGRVERSIEEGVDERGLAQTRLA
jgi:hypothetical protein